jgi:hypothetical protein
LATGGVLRQVRRDPLRRQLPAGAGTDDLDIDLRPESEKQTGPLRYIFLMANPWGSRRPPLGRMRFLWILSLVLAAGFLVSAFLSDSRFGTVTALCLALLQLVVAAMWFWQERRARAMGSAGDDQLR